MPELEPSRPTAVDGLLSLGAMTLLLYALFWASPYGLRVLTVAGTYALAAIGFQVIFGKAGALSLAHGTFFGLGAYATGILGSHWGWPFAATFPVSLLVPAVVALVVAAPVLRLESHYFALATLGIAQVVLLAAIHFQDLTGGANGVAGVPGIVLFGWAVPRGLPLAGFVWMLVALGAVLAWRLERGRRGRALEAMAADVLVARAIGLDTGRLRLEALVASALYAGAAGALAAHTQRVVSPEVLEFPVMVSILTMTVIGGRDRVTGAVAGAVLLTWLPEWFRFLERGYLLLYGAALLLTMILMPQGIAGPSRARSGRSMMPVAPGGGRDAPRIQASLVIRGLCKAFGGVAAIDGLDLVVGPGKVTGLIGPNGSGKTTLINLITGLDRPDRGIIRLGDADIAGLRPERIARLGIARTFQAGGLPPDATALAAVAAARLTLDPDVPSAEAHALHSLHAMGAAEAADRFCGSLPPGVRRRVELARALARQPALLLLDEPAAGLGPAEQADLAARLGNLAGQELTLLIVEHNMPFLLSLADRVICLDEGRIIADGPPDVVCADPAVIRAYLGALP